MIELHDVEKAYRHGERTIPVLRGLDMRLADPGFYAVMGPSGSGKSTLLHLIAGLDRADRGRLHVADHDLMQLSERALTRFRRRHVGIVFQQFNLMGSLTAAQNIALPGVLDGQARPWIRQRVDTLLDQLGLADRADHRPAALSGGEQQRVAIARALLFQPPLLLGDEPTGNLDSASSTQLWELLGQVARDHDTTVLIVTHEPAAAAQCRQVFVMRDGRFHGNFEVDDFDPSHVAHRYQQLGR